MLEFKCASGLTDSPGHSCLEPSARRIYRQLLAGVLAMLLLFEAAGRRYREAFAHVEGRKAEKEKQRNGIEEKKTLYLLRVVACFSGRRRCRSRRRVQGGGVWSEGPKS
jgi:hypothetical protein